MKQVLPLPDNFDPDLHDASHIHDFLENHGVDVQGVSLIRPYKDDGDNTIIIEIEASSDPSDVLESFVPEPSPEELVAEELSTIDLTTADLDELRRAVSLMSQLIPKRDSRHG